MRKALMKLNNLSAACFSRYHLAEREKTCLRIVCNWCVRQTTNPKDIPTTAVDSLMCRNHTKLDRRSSYKHFNDMHKTQQTKLCWERASNERGMQENEKEERLHSASTYTNLVNLRSVRIATATICMKWRLSVCAISFGMSNAMP